MNWKCLVGAIAWWIILGMGMPLLGLLQYDLRNPSEAYWSLFIEPLYIAMMIALLVLLMFAHKKKEIDE